MIDWNILIVEDIMNGLQYFFRTTMDRDSGFVLFSPLHFLLLAVTILGIIAIYRSRKLIRTDEVKRRRIKWTIFTLLLIEQIAFYLWFFVSGRFTWSESLPFYSCRISMILLLIAMVTDEPRSKALGIYFGLFGGFLAMLLPDLFKYHWPHLQWICFFAGHMLMLFAAHFLIVEGYVFDRNSLRGALTGIVAFLLAANLANVSILEANYAYLVEPPFLIETFRRILNPLQYTVLANIVYVLLIFAIYGIAHVIQSLRSKYSS